MTGPLKAPCIHGRYERHWYDMPDEPPGTGISQCPGGTLLPPDTLVIVKEDGGKWAAWAHAAIKGFSMYGPTKVLDALAAAQRGGE